MRQKLLEKIGQLAAEKTWWMLLGIIVITLIFGALSKNLEMSMNMTDLLPENDPMVDEFNYIFKEFNGASTIFVVVEGETDDMIRFAEHVTPMIKNLDTWIDSSASTKVQKEHQAAMDKVKAGKIEFDGSYIDRVDYKMEVDFMKEHGLMLVKPKDLKNTKEIFSDPNLLPFLTNLNNSLEKEYIQSEEKLSTTQREQNAVRYLDGIETWVDEVGKALYEPKYEPTYAEAAANAITIGTPYTISPDRTMLIIMVEPTFNIMEMDFVMPVINGLEELVKSEAPDYKVTAGLAGGMALGRDEMVAGLEDSMLLTVLALVAVLILFIVTFKMLSAPLLAMINLIIGLIWAMGISYLLVGTLNMFTAMMAVVLVGLGIDFSIHIISVFSELTNKGVEAKTAIIDTLKKVGTGIITGGLTTSAAFLTLMIGRSRGLSEFGLVCGLGLIILMIATLITLPTMLMIRERYRLWRGKVIKNPKDVSYAAIGNFSESIFKRWKFSLITLLIVTVFFGIMISRVTMDYNYLNMEPEGLESIILNDKVIDKFNFSSDVTMMTAKSLEENYQLTEAAKEKSSISYVESISDYLPTIDEQREREEGVRRIHDIMADTKIQTGFSSNDLEQFTEQLHRLEDNIIELQELAYIGGQDQVDQKAIRLVGTREKLNTGNLTRLIKQIGLVTPQLKRYMFLNRDFAVTYKLLVLKMANDTPITQDMLPAMIRNKFI
ncbi:MAG: MMPL family transporter, partial [bacterium]